MGIAKAKSVVALAFCSSVVACEQTANDESPSEVEAREPPQTASVSDGPAAPVEVEPGSGGIPASGAPTPRPAESVFADGMTANDGGTPNPTGGSGGAADVEPPPVNAGAPADNGAAAPAPMDAGSPTSSGGGPTSTPDAAMPPAVIVDRPSLVASTEGAYWVEGEPLEAPDETPNVRVDPETRYQTWEGFGGSFEEVGWEALGRLDEEERARALRLLFDASEGAHFVWGRLPIGASDGALDRYSLDDVADDFALENFSIERDRERLIPYLEAALAVDPELRLIAVPWSPPSWMKDNGSTDRGTIRAEPEVLDAYARYLVRYVEAYESEGFDIEAVHIQNDITFPDDIPSCEWYGPTLTDFIGNYLGPAFVAESVPAELWLGEFGIADNLTPLYEVMADPVAASFLSGISLSWDAWQEGERLGTDYGLPMMQTRHIPGNNPWDAATFDPVQAPNDFAYAVLSWVELHQWIEAGVSGYLAWNMVLDDRDEGLNQIAPWPKNTLLTIDPTTNTLSETPAYYVFRHLSYFVDPGAVRIHASGDPLEVLAFENPDGSIVVALHNPDDALAVATVGVGERTVRFDVPARGFVTVMVE